MNKDNAKDYLPLVQALAEGKVIQYKWSDAGWRDGENILFEKEPGRYRIKPEPREVWVNHYPNGGNLGCYESEQDAYKNRGIDTAVQVRYREVIE